MKYETLSVKRVVSLIKGSAWQNVPYKRLTGWKHYGSDWKALSAAQECSTHRATSGVYRCLFMPTHTHTHTVRWMRQNLGVSHSAHCHDRLREAMRRQRDFVCPFIHGAERPSSCWSHDCGTVLPGVGCAISHAIWVNRRRLLLCHEASPPDPAPLTLGRTAATHRQMAPTVGSSCRRRDCSAAGAATPTVYKFKQIHCSKKWSHTNSNCTVISEGPPAWRVNVLQLVMWVVCCFVWL